MMQIALWFILTGILCWFLAPRVFSFVDSTLIHARLGVKQISPLRTPLTVKQHRTKSVDTTIPTLVTLCDSLARHIRSGADSHDALVLSSKNEQFMQPWWDDLRLQLDSGMSVEQALQISRQHCDDADHRLCITMLLAALVQGNFIASAVDHASLVLQDRMNSQSETKVAAAQSRFSTRLLSLLPLVVVGGLLLFSNTFQEHLFSLPILIPLILGLVLNRVGWAYSLRLIHRATHESISHVEILTNHLCVSLRAGYTMWQSCVRWHDVSPLGYQVATNLHMGQLLEEALQCIKQKFPQQGSVLVDVVLQADRDGLPTINTVNRLADDARNERRRNTDIRIRQLPTRLSIPLVLCILPSFLLLTIAPMVIANLSHLAVSLPPIQQ